MASETTAYPVGMGSFPPGVVLIAGESPSLSELARSDLSAPQLVMLANVALTGEGNDYSTEEKQMVELKTVEGGGYSDSEEENLLSYGYHSQTGTGTEVCPQSCQAPSGQAAEKQQEAPVVEKERACQSPESANGVKRKLTQESGAAGKKKKPFHCKPCHYQAQCEEEFVHHIRIHSAKKLMVVGGEAKDGPATEPPGGDGGDNAKGVICCDRCGYNTNRYDHYMAHLKHHSKEGDEQRVYKCTICTYTTVSQYHWKKHLRNHFPSKLYTCAQCCYFSDRKNNYVQHIRTHTGERPFRCPYCKYSSSQKTHLTRHMRTHSGERPFKCEICSYLAANQHEVTRHARQVHDGPKPLSCPHCQYKTADRSNFKKHVELHINPRQFLCPVCSYAASKKCNLQYHIKSRHADCSDLAMDVSKVKLRIKKQENMSSSCREEGNLRSKEKKKLQEEQQEKPQEKRATCPDNVTCDDMAPINLSMKKAARKPSPMPVAEKERKDKSSKWSDGSPAMEKTAEVTEVKDGSSGKVTKASRTEGGSDKVEKKKEREARKSGKTGKVQDTMTANTRPRRECKSEKVEKKQKQGKAGKEKAEKQRLKKMEMLERERLEKTEKEKAEREKMEKLVKDRCEKERVEKENTENERPQKEKFENLGKERLAKVEKLLKDKGEKENAGVTVKEREDQRKKKQKTKPQKQVTQKTPTLEVNAELPEKAKKGIKRKSASVEPESIAPDLSSPCRKSQRKKKGEQPEGAGLLRSGRRKTMPPCQPAVSLLKRKVKHADVSKGELSPTAPAEMQESPSSSAKEASQHQLPLELPTGRRQPTDTEEDEGIHSHDGSDLSDNVSEGSDDSGLSGLPGKQSTPATPTSDLATPTSDLATPTDDMPTPTGHPASDTTAPTDSCSHTCIFCDRAFPLEVDYRKHLNRHLVNVYYLENTAGGDK